MNQVDIPLPTTLAGRGELNIDLAVAGHHAHIVTIGVKRLARQRLLVS
ncbi:MAG: hypothetical protein ACLQU1_06005 [Bryobacteraceae bacterium]